MKLKQPVVTLLLILLSLGTAASAQNRNAGKLNTWTTRPVARIHEGAEATHLRSVRAAKHKGFDRIVFDFTGPVPNYTVEYHPSRFYDDNSGRREIKIAGKTFVHVNLNSIPVDDEQLKFTEGADFVPKGRLKLPVLWEIEAAGFFEGHYDFLLGLKSRRLFRVTELTYPARLVIDFRQ